MTVKTNQKVVFPTMRMQQKLVRQISDHMDDSIPCWNGQNGHFESAFLDLVAEPELVPKCLVLLRAKQILVDHDEMVALEATRDGHSWWDSCHCIECADQLDEEEVVVGN